MSSPIDRSNANFQQQFEKNFEVDEFKDTTGATSNANTQSTSSSSGGLGSTQGSGEPAKASGTSSTDSQNMAAMYMEAMMCFYTANSDDMMNKGNEMAAQTANAQHLSDIQVQISNAEAAGGSSNITVQTGGSSTGVSGSGSNTVLTISASDEQFLQNYGIDCPTGNSVNSTQLSDFDNATNTEEETLSGTNEQLMLDVQLASQNMSQAASAATSGMQGIGSSLKSTAQNTGG